MEKYKEFINNRNEGVVQILILTLDNSNVMNQLILNFNSAVQKLHHSYNSVEMLETLHTVLCSIYQERFGRYRKKTEPEIKVYMYERFANKFKKISVIEVQRILYANRYFEVESCHHAKALSMILDILILHNVLYADEIFILAYLRGIQDITYQHLVEENNVRHLDIKLTECYLNSLLLRRMHSKSKELYDKDISALFLKNVKLWLTTLKKSQEYKFLTLLLPKLILLIAEEGTLTKIWKLIFTIKNDQEITLSLLFATADVWFPIQSRNNKCLNDQALEEPFWMLLLEGLSSGIPNQQKQASYLYKRVVDFYYKSNNTNLKTTDCPESRVSLVCDNSMENSFKKSLDNLFSIIESLEDEEKSLDTKVFPHLKNQLLDETFDQKNCETGFHIAWVHCAFIRILRHDNDAVVKWGLVNVFTLDPKLYNDYFLNIILNVLNDTDLYANDATQEEPLVLKELIQFLNCAKTMNSDLVTRFMVLASKITWDPVPLFYMIHAIFMVKKVDNIWKDVELGAVKSLVQISSTVHCKILRIGSQIELLEAMTHFVTESLDLMAVAKTLLVFPTSGVLVRGQLAWNRISCWLSKAVKQDEALKFLEEICGEIKNENFQENFTVKLLSLMIMLFHDGQLILNSKLCPGLTILHNLLGCLIQPESRRDVKVKLKNRSIELICHLLEFTSPKDCVLRKLISHYAEASLQFTFKNLRKVCDEELVDNIDTYVSLTQQLFTAETLIITKREVLNYIERFEIESWNIIGDGEYSNNVQRLFGIKILYVCLKARSMNLKNYKFMGPLCKTYKTPMTQLSDDAEEADRTENKNEDMNQKIAVEYYKFVAKLFYEYSKDVPLDECILSINWIEEVSYLIRVDGTEICVPIIGILSQIFHKGVRSKDMDDFKTATKLCWKFALGSNESAWEEMIRFLFSPAFLESKETRELTIECTNEMLDIRDGNRVLSILLKGLRQVQGEYLSHFYEAVLACILRGTTSERDEIIAMQASSYVLDSYEEVYPKYLSNMNINENAATRADAIILLHEMITDNPTHAVQLLPLISTKVADRSNEHHCHQCSPTDYVQSRSMQVLLILQPLLEKDDVQTLYSLMCDNIFSESAQPSARLMQEWLLIKLYLENDSLRAKIWDLFNQDQEKHAHGLSSVIRIVYHVARLLSSNLQPDFIDLAFQYIMPCCMVQQFNVHSFAQVIASKLYDVATEKSYSTMTEKYKELHNAIVKSLKYEDLKENAVRLQDDFYLNILNPIEDYSLQTLFYEMPKLSKTSSDELIPPQTFEKFGFKESNRHPLKLLNLKMDACEVQASADLLKPGKSTTADIASNMDCCDDKTDIQKHLMQWEGSEHNENESSEVSKTTVSREESDVVLVTSLSKKLPNLRGLIEICKTLGVKEFVVSSIKHPEDKEFQSFSDSVENLLEVKPSKLPQYLAKKKSMGYRLVGVEKTSDNTNLANMKFDRKTVILLGNEKTGIPAKLMPLLHECVEIP